MKRYTLAQIENRLSKIELYNDDSIEGEQYVGRHYDELTDAEKEEYFDYLYGKNRGFTHETHEKLIRMMCDNEEEYKARMHEACEKRERDPNIPLSEKEFQQRVKEVKEFLRGKNENDSESRI